MKFTIFSPFYNYLDAAEDLFNSIVNQTYPNWEWLISDDFSDTPDVKEKLLEFEKRDSRIKVIETKWKAQYYYNLPVEHASGDIILKIDSDDIPSLKLLEVYKFNYEKFPDVISIGCTSVIKKNTYDGFIAGAKYINYKNTSNFLESSKFGVISIIGDARSYKISALKNKGLFVNENEFDFIFGEEVHKILMVEEWGKFFSIPRVLHNYTMRDNSNSGGATVHKETSEETKRKLNLFSTKLKIDAEFRFDRNKLFSIEKYYDSSFDHAKNFYLSQLDLETSHLKIEYWSNLVAIEDMKKLDELYYDHSLSYNKVTENPNYIIIDGVSNFDSVTSALSNRNLKDCVITITTSNEKRDEMGDLLKSMGYGYWYNIFYYTTFRIKL